MTSIGNDYDYASIFARQVQALGRAGDVAIALSTSGNSPNVVAGLERAGKLGLKTIALTGAGGGRLAGVAEVLLDVPSKCPPRVQEAHAVIYHTICQMVEQGIAERTDG
jgi:D-sedoheptulose 7-phosphate isomerase